MKTTLYLHIGTPKTATTSIQNFLPANEEILERHGICYADLGFRYPKVGIYRNAEFLVTTSYRDENGRRILEKEQEDYRQGLQKLQEIGKKFPKIILSDEGIWQKSLFYRKNFWEKLKEDLDAIGFETKIIVYFRRQDLFSQSRWAQKIKEGATYSFQGYLADPSSINYPLDYYAYMSKLANIFGKDALILRVFEKQQFRGEEKTIHSDFLDIFGLKIKDGFVLQKEVYNTSFEGDYLEMKTILNYFPEFKSNRHLLISTMKSIQDEKFFEYNYRKCTYFGPGEQERFMEQFNESNAKLASEFMGRADGKLFYDDVKQYPEYSIDTRNLLVDTILVYGKVIGIINDKCNENTKQIEALKKKLEEKSEKQKETDRELKEMIRALEQTSLLFRIRRKWRHITGKDR